MLFSFFVMCYTNVMDKNNLCIGVCRIQQLSEIINNILDPNKMVVFTTAPAPRVALGELFNLQNANLQSKIVGFLKMLGVDYVFDTSFGADLTTISEAYELYERLLQKNKLPLLNSCCPAFVKYIQNFNKELSNNLSTAKTPIAQIATYTKTYFALKHNLTPKDIYIVALTPCLAKKLEIKENFITDKEFNDFISKNSNISSITKPFRKQLTKETINLLNKLKNYNENCNENCQNTFTCPNINNKAKNNNIQLTDAVITTNELYQLMTICGLSLDDIADENCDDFNGKSLRFGASGGVLESVVNTLYTIYLQKNPTQNLFNYEVIDNNIWRASINISNCANLNVAKIVGLQNVEKFFKSHNLNDYQFIEVMTCQGGCIGGTGQPKTEIQKIQNRRKILLKEQAKSFALDNLDALNFYKQNKDLCYKV